MAMIPPSTMNLNKGFTDQEPLVLKAPKALSTSMKTRKKTDPRMTANSVASNPMGNKITSDQIYPPLDPHFTFENTNYQFGLKSREEFYKYLNGTGFFDKLSNVIAKLEGRRRNQEGGVQFVLREERRRVHPRAIRR